MVDFKIIRRTRNFAEKKAAVKAERLKAKKEELLNRLEALRKLQSKLK